MEDLQAASVLEATIFVVVSILVSSIVVVPVVVTIVGGLSFSYEKIS